MLKRASIDQVFQENRWFLEYLHAGHEFPIGRIDDGDWDSAKDCVNNLMGLGDLAPIIHLDPAHENHDQVEELGLPPTGHMIFNGDAIILPKCGKWSVGMFMADCASVVLEGNDHMAFLHMGRKEVLGGLTEKLCLTWPEQFTSCGVWIGPVISAMFYEMPDTESIALAGGAEYLTPRSVWGTRGFSILCGIIDQLIGLGISPNRIIEAEFCPYAARLAGLDQWASDQWFKKNRPNERSPRDFVWFHYDDNGVE